MNHKRKGSRAEYKSKRVLEALGYSVTRSGASLGVFDLIGIGPTDFVGVQVKSNRAPSPAEREQIKLFVCPWNMRKLCHIWTDRMRHPKVIEL